MMRGIFERRHVAALLIGLAFMAVLVIVIQLIVTSAVNSTLVVDRQKANGKKLDTSAETLKIIKSCTTPGGKCFEASQKRTAKVVVEIGKANAYAAAAAASCAQVPNRSFEVIYECTARRLETIDRGAAR